jgi:shikimate dehydrogenase
MVTGATAVVGIIGGPEQVRLSLSPTIHNAAFEALGLNWLYLPFPVEEGFVTAALQGLAAAGVRGVNVTTPHKLAAAEAVDRSEGAALAVGAVNTVEMRSGQLIGWNTDGEGLVRFLRRDVGAAVEGAVVLLLGAGGAARAAVAALSSAGAASITVAARDPSRGEALRALAGEAFLEVIPFAAPNAPHVKRADLIVNATPLGQRGETPPIAIEAIRPDAIVVDLNYSPPMTRLAELARERGATAHNGLGMLLHQAALSFEIWTGVTPPLDVMSAAAVRQLRLAGLS